MQSRNVKFIALGSAIFCWLAGLGCAPNAGRSASRAAQVRSQPAPGPLPGELEVVLAKAKDIMDTAPLNEWSRVAVAVSEIHQAWEGYQAHSSSRTLSAAVSVCLDKLREKSEVQSTIPTLLAANDLRAAVLNLADLYTGAAPPDIGRLDVYERQIILDVSAKNMPAMAGDLEKLRAVWERIQPVVAARGGEAAAALFEECLARQAEALEYNETDRLAGEATAGLELVDALAAVTQR